MGGNLTSHPSTVSTRASNGCVMQYHNSIRCRVLLEAAARLNRYFNALGLSSFRCFWPDQLNAEGLRSIADNFTRQVDQTVSLIGLNSTSNYDEGAITALTAKYAERRLERLGFDRMAIDEFLECYPDYTEKGWASTEAWNESCRDNFEGYPSAREAAASDCGVTQSYTGRGSTDLHPGGSKRRGSDAGQLRRRSTEEASGVRGHRRGSVAEDDSSEPPASDGRPPRAGKRGLQRRRAAGERSASPARRGVTTDGSYSVQGRRAIHTFCVHDKLLDARMWPHCIELGPAVLNGICIDDEHPVRPSRMGLGEFTDPESALSGFIFAYGFRSPVDNETDRFIPVLAGWTAACHEDGYRDREIKGILSWLGDHAELRGRGGSRLLSDDSLDDSFDKPRSGKQAEQWQAERPQAAAAVFSESTLTEVHTAFLWRMILDSLWWRVCEGDQNEESQRFVSFVLPDLVQFPLSAIALLDELVDRKIAFQHFSDPVHFKGTHSQGGKCACRKIFTKDSVDNVASYLLISLPKFKSFIADLVRNYPEAGQDYGSAGRATTRRSLAATRRAPQTPLEAVALGIPSPGVIAEFRALRGPKLPTSKETSDSASESAIICVKVAGASAESKSVSGPTGSGGSTKSPPGRGGISSDSDPDEGIPIVEPSMSSESVSQHSSRASADNIDVHLDATIMLGGVPARPLVGRSPGEAGGWPATSRSLPGKHILGAADCGASKPHNKRQRTDL